METLSIDRRRLGTGLFAFGIIGVVLAGLIGVGLLVGALAARDLDERLVRDQDRIGAALTRLTITLDTIATTTDDASATLATSGETVAEAALVLADVADTSQSLANALDIDVLGTRPFSPVAASIRDVAARLQAFEDDATHLAVNLDANAGDVTALSDEIRSVKTQVNALAASITGFDRIGQLVGMLIGGIVLGGLLAAWVAAGAASCAWIGWRLRRAGAAAAGTAADTAADTGPATGGDGSDDGSDDLV